MTTKAFNQSGVDVAKYKEVKELLPQGLNAICLGVAAANDISYTLTFHSKDRHQEYVILRQYASWLACCQNRMSLKQIGKLINQQDHSTVIHSRNTVRNLFDANDGRINEVHRNYVNYLGGSQSVYNFIEYERQVV